MPNGTPSSRRPRSKSVTTGTKPGSMRGIVKNLGQEHFGRFERLLSSAIAQFGVGEEIGRYR